MLLASQMSISEQQEPTLPTPAFSSLEDDFQPSMLACTSHQLLLQDTKRTRRETYLAVDELQITGALGIAVAGSVLGTGLVGRVLGHSTVGIHGDKIQGSVQAALVVMLASHFKTQFMGGGFCLTGRLETSTSKANSLPARVNIWYESSLSIR